MRSIWMLTAANLRKSKSQTISLLIFALIAAMLLNIGLVVSLKIGVFFDEQAEHNHTAHFTGIYNTGAGSIDEGRRFMESRSDITEIETVNAVGGWAEYNLGGTGGNSLFILSRADENQKMDSLALIGDSLPLTDDAIYIPYSMMKAGAFNLGDNFSFKLAGTELSFTVAGATEEIMFGAQMVEFTRFYISVERFEQIGQQFPQNGLTLLSARLADRNNTALFSDTYNMSVPADGLIQGLNYDIAKTARTMIPNVVAAMMTAFAVMLLIVCLIVIRFRIINSIEDSMINIGTQKAVGYRSVQIIASIVLQFGLIALAGSLAGVALSQAAIPMIVKIWEPILALVWNPEFDAVLATAAIAVVLLAVTPVSWLSARRINKLHPLAALRGGNSTHSMRRNRLPLDKAQAPLDLLLALKRLLQGKRQAAGISIIVAVVTAASVAGVVLNYNLSVRGNDLARSMYGEIPDVTFRLNSGESGEVFKEKLLTRSEVRKAFGYMNFGISLFVGDTSTTLMIAEDCSMLESDMLIEGRYPKHDNEIALGTVTLSMIGAKIGDTVPVGNGETQREYLVTGIVQTTEGGGRNGIINADGLLQLRPDFSFTSYAVYLNTGADTAVFIEDMRAAEGNAIETTFSAQETMDGMINNVSGIFAAVSAGIWAVTVFVIILVLYMVIKTMILRRKRELGIQKAIGFTTIRLMNQISLNMAPIILIGVILGAIIGYFGVNPMYIALFSGMGIAKIELFVPIGQTVIVSAALVVFSYFVSMLIAWRIRKISAYALVTE